MALITGYFGSKLGLFEEAVLPHLGLAWLVEGGIADVTERLVDKYLNAEPFPTFDPTVVFLRSVTDRFHPVCEVRVSWSSNSCVTSIPMLSFVVSRVSWKNGCGIGAEPKISAPREYLAPLLVINWKECSDGEIQ